MGREEEEIPKMPDFPSRGPEELDLSRIWAPVNDEDDEPDNDPDEALREIWGELSPEGPCAGGLCQHEESGYDFEYKEEIFYDSRNETVAELALPKRTAWQRRRMQTNFAGNIITKLTPGVRDPNRVNVFINNRFDFSLDVTQVVDFQLKVGLQVDDKRLAELHRASEFGKLYQRTLEWVLTRPHSVREARDYLRRRQIKRRQTNRARVKEGKEPFAEIADDVMELVMERLIEKGYLDDKKFAKFYVENRYVRKGISQKRLRMELSRKGVESEIANQFLQQDIRDDKEEIMKMIAKKHKRYSDFKLVGYLVRQGFNFQLAKDSVEKYHQEHPEE